MNKTLADLCLSREELADFKRPRLRSATREAVMANAPHDDNGALMCGFCTLPIHGTLHLNHKERWADIRKQAMNDPLLLALSRMDRRAALSELFNDPQNLEPVHPRCNDRHTRRIENQRHADYFNEEKKR